MLSGLGVMGLFTDHCDRCSPADLSLAHRCCSSGHTLCCGLLHTPATAHTFPGQISVLPGQSPGHFSGPVSGKHLPGHFPGQFAGLKVGKCPVIGGVHTGFSRFSGTVCVAECSIDFQCPGIMKCCPVGCSTVCRAPAGG